MLCTAFNSSTENITCHIYIHTYMCVYIPYHTNHICVYIYTYMYVCFLKMFSSYLVYDINNMQKPLAYVH